MKNESVHTYSLNKLFDVDIIETVWEALVMIKIVRITTQKNNTERFNIFVDRGNGEEYGFSVDQDVFIEFGLRKGNSYSETELNDILHKDEIKKAYNLALNFLSYRMRSEKEIHDYLITKTFAEDIIKSVLQRLRDNNFVNDLEFALAFVSSRIQTSVKGPILIRQELYKKGLSEANIIEGLKVYTEEKQLEIASSFAGKNANQRKNLSDYQIRQKIGQALISKGFPHEIIQTALNEMTIKKDDDERFYAVTVQGNKAIKKYCSKYEGWELTQKVKQYLFQRGFNSEDIDVFINQLQESDL